METKDELDSQNSATPRLSDPPLLKLTSVELVISDLGGSALPDQFLP
jgi:hypothetical protein